MQYFPFLNSTKRLFWGYPAFDVIYAHNPAGQWTNRHQMSINGKRDQINLTDLTEIGNSISISKPSNIISEVGDAISQWPSFAAKAGVDKNTVNTISGHHRLKL